MRIVYVPLEPYEERYTLQLREWNIQEFNSLGVDYIVVDGKRLDDSKAINTGVVLDAHSRSYYALSQCMHLVEMHRNGNLKSDDFIYFEDMFHPGLEALAYCFQLSEYSKRISSPLIAVRCLAQTIDSDDFVHYTGLADWMRHYEHMVNSFVDVVFMNSEEMIPYMTAAGWQVPVAVTGLPFGKLEVLHRAGNNIVPFYNRPRDVVFASRIAAEKQPEFFIAVAKEFASRCPDPSVVFKILSGAKISSPVIEREILLGSLRLEVHSHLKKEDYYKHLGNARVLFNASLQDWGSVVLPEADTLGTNVLFPAYRSFPEIFRSDKDRMYIPWSVHDAVNKLEQLLLEPHPEIGKISDYQNGSIARSVKIMNDIIEHGFCQELVIPSDISYRQRITERAVKGYL